MYVWWSYYSTLHSHLRRSMKWSMLLGQWVSHIIFINFKSRNSLPSQKKNKYCLYVAYFVLHLENNCLIPKCHKNSKYEYFLTFKILLIFSMFQFTHSVFLLQNVVQATIILFGLTANTSSIVLWRRVSIHLVHIKNIS